MKKRFTETQVAFVLCQAAMKYLVALVSEESRESLDLSRFPVTQHS